MKREVMIEWVKALRSGQYKQGKSYLKRDDTYCCLGVLCELSKLSQFTPNTVTGVAVYDKASQFLPSRVGKWAGMCTKDGVLSGDLTLVSKNDTGVGFEQIADLIEQNWEKL